MPVQAYLELVLLLLVTAAAINDVVARRIPNRLLLAGWLLVLPLHALSAAPGAALLSCLGGALAGLALFLPLYLLRATAAGDVKLMATVGAFVGPAQAFQIVVLTWCVGGVLALLIVARNGALRQALANVRGLLASLLYPGYQPAAPGASLGGMPYGVAIAFATIWGLVANT